MTSEYDLIDHEKIKTAQAAVDAALARQAATAALLEKADAALAEAEAASQRAVAAGGDGLREEHAIAAATIVARAAKKVGDAAGYAVTEARDGLKRETAAAHLPVFWGGVKARIAACRAGDQALTALAQAGDDFREATRLLAVAQQAGFLLPACAQALQSPATLTTLEAERSRWAAFQVDVEREKLPGESA